MLQLRVLGPVELRVGDRVLNLGPPRQRTVFAALALDAGRPVPMETLVDRVWHEDPPAQPRSTLYAHVTRLRQLFAQAARQGNGSLQLHRRDGGYQLDVDLDAVDVHRFRRLVDLARSVDGEARAVHLRQALALWRGDPLTGVSGGWIAQARESLRQQRLDAVVTWARTELRLDNHEAVIGQLSASVLEYPLVEPLTAALIRALYGVGRIAEAIERYLTIQERLADELGIDPGPELRHLYQEMLRGPTEDARAPSAGPSTGPPLTGPPLTGPSSTAPGLTAPATSVRRPPAQLPADVPNFTGRIAELARLDELLAASPDTPGAVVISVLSGTAGIGKTSLAVHWAHRVAHRFPDGQLYVNLRGFGPEEVISPGEAVRGFLDTLGLPPERIPVDLDAQAACYRSTLAGRRMLILLDNARDVQQVRPLLPNSPTCLVLVTSRNQLAGLLAAQAAAPLPLELLPPQEARQLLTLRLGPARVRAQPLAVDEIVARSARLPLALSIVAARAAANPHFDLAAIADELRQGAGSLDPFETGDANTEIRTVFSWSYRALGPEPARMFRLLGLLPGAGIALAAAASLAGVPARAARRTLGELTRAHLLTELTPGRYAFHDLLRAYATELVREVDPGADQRAARQRALEHYLHTAYQAERLLRPHREALDMPPVAAGVTVAAGATADGATDLTWAAAWFRTEREMLVAMMQQAANHGLDHHVWRLAWCLESTLDLHGRWQEQVASQATALQAVQRLGDTAGQARVHRGLARAEFRLGRHLDARHHLDLALDLFDQLGDPVRKADTHLSLALVRAHENAHAEALDQAQRAHELYLLAGDEVGQARALNAIGWCHAGLGAYRESVACCKRALELQHHLDDAMGQAHTLDSLGFAYRHLGDPERAVDCYQEALELCRAYGARGVEAEMLVHLGDACHAMGDRVGSRKAWSQALAVLEELEHPEAEHVRNLLGHDASSQAGAGSSAARRW